MISLAESAIKDYLPNLSRSYIPVVSGFVSLHDIEETLTGQEQSDTFSSVFSSGRCVLAEWWNAIAKIQSMIQTGYECIIWNGDTKPMSRGLM